MLKNYFTTIFLCCLSYTYAQTNKSESQDLINKDKVVTIYPNPMGNTFRINGIVSKAEIAVYNVLGKKLLDISNYKGQKIQTNNWKSGVYLVRVRMDDGSDIITRKLIKV